MEKVKIIIIFLILSRFSFALEGSPYFSYQSRLVDGGGTPITSVIDFTFQIFNSAGNCLLYEEQQTGIDLNPTAGVVSLLVGSPLADAKRTANDPGLEMVAIYTNSGAVLRAPGANCVAGYTALAGEERLLRVTTDDGGVITVLTPDRSIHGVPFALVSQSLQGLIPSQIIQVGGNVTQANMTTLTGAGDGSALHHHDSRYLQTGGVDLGNGSHVLGQFSVGTATPVAGADFTLGADSNRIITMGRDALGAGSNLSLISGGAQNGSTDQNGGNLIMSSGTSTGTGSSDIQFQTASSAASGTADNIATTKMIITGGGNIGVGTTTPNERLTINGVVSLLEQAASPSDTATYGKLFVRSSDDALIYRREDSSEFVLNTPGADNSQASNVVLNADNNNDGTGDIIIQESGVELMRITNAGNVGIGNTNPASPLDVSGDINQRGIAAPSVSPAGQGRIYFDSTANRFRVSENGAAYSNLVTSSNSLIDADNDTQIQIEEIADEDMIRFDTAGSERMIIQNDGRVGVGVTSPIPGDIFFYIDRSIAGSATELRVANLNNTNIGSHANIKMQTGGGVSGDPFLSWLISSQAAFHMGLDNTDDTFKIAGGNSGVADLSSNVRMSITQTGLVGINTSSPSGMLEIESNTATTEALVLQTRDNGTIRKIFNVEDSGGTTIASIHSTGVPTDTRDLTTKTYVDTAISGINSIDDADGNTQIQVEESANDDVIRFDSAGTEKVTIDSGGLRLQDTSQLFFPGTNSPILTGDTSGAFSRFIVQGSGGNQNTSFFGLPSGTATQTLFQAANSSSITNRGRAVFGVDGTTALLSVDRVGTGTSPTVLEIGEAGPGATSFLQNIDFQFGQTTLMRFESSGRLGIGNTNPGSVLDINGDLNLRGLAAPAVSPAGQGRIYFDSTANRFLVSENGGAYSNLAGGVDNTQDDNVTINADNNANGTGDIIFQESGAEFARFTNAGNLGLGITNPTNKLEVVGGTISSPHTGARSERFGNGATATVNDTVAIGNNADATGFNAIAIGSNAVANFTDTIAIGRNSSVGSTSAIAIGDSALAPSSSVAIGDRAIATGTQNVLVGSFSTAGDDSVAMGRSANAGQSAISMGRDANASALSSIALGRLSAASGNSAIAIGRSANASATEAIAIGENAIADVANTMVVGATSREISNVYFGNGRQNASPSGTTINATGGTGTDIAGANLSLAGGQSTGSGNGGSIIFRTSPAGGAGTAVNALSTRMTLSSAGQLGIGTTGPNDTLDVVGDVDATGCFQNNDAGTIGGTCVSDIRLKENFSFLNDSLHKVLSLKPVYYNWRSEFNLIHKREGRELGLIAQEVEEVFPEMVEEGQDGYKRVKYDISLKLHLVQAIKDLFSLFSEDKERQAHKIAYLEEENRILKEYLCQKDSDAPFCQ